MDVEINHIKIIIIQYLPQEDEQQGLHLYENIRQLEKEDDKYSVEYYQVQSKEQFLEALEYIAKTVDEQTLVTLHIDAHANEMGLGISIPDNFVTWRQLLDYTRPINIITNNTLTLIMSTCEGSSLIGSLDPTDRAPFMVIVANPRPITFEDMELGFPNFYKIYRTPLDLSKATDALNDSIDFSKPLPDGSQKEKFDPIMACRLFDEFFKPYRVPNYFIQLVDKSIESEEDRIKAAQVLWCIEGEKLKPYFNFKSDKKSI